MKGLLIAVALLLLIVPTVQAQSDIPALDWRRFVWVAEGGVQAYQGTDGAVIGNDYGAYTALGLGWSSGPKLVLGAIYGQDWTNKAYRGLLAARWMITDPTNGGRMRLALGVNGVYYHGDGYAFIYDPDKNYDWSWNLGLYGSMNLIGISYLKINADWDMENNFPTARIALAISDAFAH